MLARTKLLACFAALPIGLIVAEIAVRLLALRPPAMHLGRGALFRSSADPLLGHELIPGANFDLHYPAEAGRPSWSAAIRISEQGLRNAVVQPKPDGVYRILCLGDSHTLGHGVSVEQSWPAQLQALLPAGLEGSYEVINAGVSHYDTEREVQLLCTRLLWMQPDLVLIQYFCNDSNPRSNEKRARGMHEKLLTLTSPNSRNSLAGWRRHSRLLDLCSDRVWRLAVAAELRTDAEAVRAADDPGWLRVQNALLRADAQSRQSNYQLAVVAFPLMIRLGEHLAGRGAARQLGAFCLQNQIPFFDGEPALAQANLERLTVSRTDLHASAEAYLVFAQSLRAWLLANELLPPSNALGR